jgi:hypothetical protein
VAHVTKKNPAALPYAELDRTVTVLYLQIEDQAKLDRACQTIQAAKRGHDVCVLGFGTQAQLPPQGQWQGHRWQWIATIQLALESQVWVIQVSYYSLVSS